MIENVLRMCDGLHPECVGGKNNRFEATCFFITCNSTVNEKAVHNFMSQVFFGLFVFP